MSTRCKFTCVSKREFRAWNGKNLFEYEFRAVTTESPENKAFFEATPDGNLKVSVVKDGSFEVGRDYYLDLSPIVAS